MEHAEIVIDYILDSEEKDYLEWCADNNLNPKVICTETLNHIYARAICAEKFELGRSMQEYSFKL